LDVAWFVDENPDVFVVLDRNPAAVTFNSFALAEATD
jgi:hypothetical protein